MAPPRARRGEAMLGSFIRRWPTSALAGLLGVVTLAIWIGWRPQDSTYPTRDQLLAQTCPPRATVTVTATTTASATKPTDAPGAGQAHDAHADSSAVVVVVAAAAAEKPQKIAWQAGPVDVIDTDAGSSAAIKRSKFPVCAFRNLCIRDPGRNPGGFDHGHPTEIMLLATTTEAKSRRPEVATMLQDCFQLAKLAEFGVVSDYDPAQLRWINGTTYLAQKIEKGHHPAAWGRAWAILLSNLAWQYDFLSSMLKLGPNSKLDQALLIGHSYWLNGWEEFYMHAALRSVADVTSGFVDASSTTYLDQAALKNDDQNFVCFEKAFSAKETNNYYFHRSEAEAFRTNARLALGFPDEPVPCSAKDFKVLFLQRPHPLPRPLWNADKLLEELAALGFENVKLGSVAETTPFFQQAALFREADLVISVHGSQLGNLVYMRDQTYIIEIFPHKYYSNQPHTLSMVLDRKHFQMLSNPLPPIDYVRDTNAEYLELAEECHAMDDQFADYAACYADGRCRSAMRQIGAYADVDEFRSFLVKILKERADALECSL
ncbi:hypothetical protein ACM66B_003322 [Microbotryomycetes sp. NB124-2]